MRLIDREKTANKLLEIAEMIEQSMGYEKAGPYITTAMFIRDNDKELPTVDAEIVVRCQNCKHHGSCGYEDTPGWYCADGERRSNA